MKRSYGLGPDDGAVFRDEFDPGRSVVLGCVEEIAEYAG
jgi:hypothetical protein